MVLLVVNLMSLQLFILSMLMPLLVFDIIEYQVYPDNFVLSFLADSFMEPSQFHSHLILQEVTYLILHQCTAYFALQIPFTISIVVI